MNRELIEKLNLKRTDNCLAIREICEKKLWLWPNGIPGCKTYVLDFDVKGKKLDDEALFIVRWKTSYNMLFYYIPLAITEDEDIFNHYIGIIKDTISGIGPQFGAVDLGPGFT